MSGTITKYPQGSDITILNTIYHEARRDQNTGKWVKSSIDIIYKDNASGEKGHCHKVDPDYHYYMLKPGIQYDYNKLFVKASDVDEYAAPESQLEKDIATRTDNLKFFYSNIDAGNRRANKALHTIPSIFDSDSNMSDHYRYLFSKQYKNTVGAVTKSYLDIEVDSRTAAGDFAQLGECPINAVTFIDDKTKSINTYLLRDPQNPLCAKFEEDVRNGSIYTRFRAAIYDHIVNRGTKSANDMKEALDNSGLMEYSMKFFFFDIEIELLITLFRLINTTRPDFVLAWNMAFDIPYIIERIKELGFDPAEIMTCDDFEKKVAEYFVDERHSSIYELRGDYYNISSYSVYLCQMIQFASRRKGQAAFPNFKLDTAGEIIAGFGKYDWSGIVSKLEDLPQVDYEKFVLYNILDTITQKFIELHSQDVDYVYNTTVMYNTRYSKCHRQTVYLINKFRKFCWDRGYIINNNCNLDNEPIYFDGAIVHDPKNTSDYAKIRIYDEIMNCYDNLDDFDYKSLYPSVAREHNTSPDTIIGKVEIDEQIFKNENPFNYTLNRGGSFMDDWTTDNPVEFGRRWFGLAGYRDLLEDVNEYMTRINVTNPSYDGYARPFVVLDRDGSYNPEPPTRMFVIHGDANVVKTALSGLEVV